ncbi:hypothetical protein ppKF707_3046 [Metapseudomonas furukawaii]|uniref:Uncharacterized protein n=1 Tax=Metapseudomonas furukawaii TaxID=1149133 RepID=A0AAD1FFW2_METFU|nr:hypothetical protein ppKF707_3046 [Pseudomonas furukawaii]BAU74414.1 hypothetical protein KF707C_27260 [Pseudomonas furukawaii]
MGKARAGKQREQQGDSVHGRTPAWAMEGGCNQCCVFAGFRQRP